LAKLVIVRAAKQRVTKWRNVDFIIWFYVDFETTVERRRKRERKWEWERERERVRVREWE
jgi:hypothetical protein